MGTKQTEIFNKFVDAAKDINKILKPEPPINETDEDTIKTELKEMVSLIAKTDNLAVSTWSVMKELGWKDAEKDEKKPSKKAEPKPAKEEKKTDKSEKKPAKKTEPKKEKYVREKAFVEAVLAMASKVAKTTDEVSKKADDLYVAKGGDSNVKQSGVITVIGVKFLTAAGWLTITEEGKIKKA